MATLLKKILTTLLLTVIFLLCSCDTETTDTHTDEKTQSPLVGTWETEESFNQKNGFKYIYEINSDNKASFSMEYIFDVNPDGETVLIKKGEYLKVEGTASTTADKITITNVKVANDSTMSKEMIAQMIQEPLNDMEIEYRYLTELSVEIKNVYCDDDGKEIEEWITLKKVTGTNNNGNSDNKNDNTEYSIIGSWENTQTIDADGNSAEMKITYVISADKFTTIAEYNFMGTQITDTIDGTITKITDGTIYYTFVSPEDGITEAESVAIYKDLTADSVKFKGIDAYGNEVWLTFTKKTNTNNNDNKNDNTEYSIIGSWGFTQTIENTDGTSMEMKVTYVITADKFTATAEYNIMDTQVKDTIEGTITKIENGMVYYTFLSPEDNTTEVESVVIYKDLTADSVKFKNIDAYGNDVWLTFTKVTGTNNNGNSDNKNDNTEYSIIGSWTNTQTADTIDGSSMEIKTTYVITADKITSYGEFNGQKSTYEMTITKIESGKIYCIGLSPVDNTTEVTSILMYKDLTADSVKIALYSIESDVWLTFTKVKM